MIYSHTYTSEIFQKSDCINIELAVAEILRKILEISQYTALDEQKFIYRKNNTTVYLALVDSVEHLNYNNNEAFLDSFTKDDLIITDNFLHHPCKARIVHLPHSWFGIYSYSQQKTASTPDCHYSFKSRRVDSTRLEIFLELLTNTHTQSSYTSFDCADHRDFSSINDKIQNLDNAWQELPVILQQKYETQYYNLKTNIPWNNHPQIDIDKAMQKSLCNVVIETYSSDHVTALSEKTFRALVTPRLWTLFAGYKSIGFLQQLGFDVLDDIVLHNLYDSLTREQNKISVFAHASLDTATKNNWDDVKHRCQQAAMHNQKLLQQYRAQWACDFSKWLKDLSSIL